MVDAHEILIGFCLGAAGIALWLAVRFPSLGPQRLLTAILIAIGATLVLPLAAATFGVVADLARVAAAIGLLVIVLPALTFAFWAAACAMRAISRHA